jgi:hypothetical protein
LNDILKPDPNKIIEAILHMAEESPDMDEEHMITIATDKGAEDPEATVKIVMERLGRNDGESGNKPSAFGVAHNPNKEKNTMAKDIASWRF